MNRTFQHVLVQAALGALSVAVLAGCPAEVITPPPEIAPAPRIVSFSASPTRISEQGTITLSWETEDATEVKITDPARGEISGVNGLSGTVDVQVEGSTLFVLSARNARGVIDSAAVGIELESGVEQVQFFVSPTQIDADGSVVVAWSAPGARSVTLTANGAPVDLQGQRSSGSIVLTLIATTDFVFTADDVVREERVLVKPQLLDFSVSPEAVTPGDQVMVSWRTSGATQVQVEEGSRGVVLAPITEPGRVREGSFVETIPADADPRAVFSYRLRATGPDGELTSVKKVYIAGSPHVTSFEVPPFARLGQEITLQWTTVQAVRVEVRSGGAVLYQSPDVDQAAVGSLVLPSPTQETRYTLHAFGMRGGEHSLSGVTEPVGMPAIASFTASAPSLAVGGEPVVLSWNVSWASSIRIYAIDGMHVHTSEEVHATGSVTVYPNTTTDYVLEIDNGLGELATADLNVTVTTPSAITLTPHAPPYIEGAPLALTYPGADDGAQMYGYPHGDVEFKTASTSFIDISKTGTQLTFTGDDDGYAQFTPNQFESFVWGERYEGKVTANVNGWLSLTESTATTYSNTSLPTATSSVPVSMLAAFWDDLHVRSTGKAHWAVVGQAPDRILVVQWSDVQLRSDSSSSLTFQVQVFQTGVVRYVYKTMNFGTTSPTYNVGTQNSTRSAGRNFTGTPVSSSEVTFFGPKSAPLSGVATLGGGTLTGFIKKGGGYVRAAFEMPEVVKPGTVRVTELMYRPSVAGSEYVEFFNNNLFALDLHGFELTNGTQTITFDRARGNTIMPPSGTLVVGKSRDPLENDELGDLIDYAYGSDFELPDTGATLVLSKALTMTSRAYSETATSAPGIAWVIDPGLFRIYGNGTTNYLLLCGAGASSAFGSQVPQQRGTPGQLTSCFGYVMTKIEPRYYDISTLPGTLSLWPTTDPYMGGYFLTQELTGGFTFPFYGVNYSSLRVTGFGYLVFGDQTLPSFPNSMNFTVPTDSSPNGCLSVFGEFLYKNTLFADAGVHYRWVGEHEDPNTPDGHWIFQWTHVGYSSSTKDDMNFQAKLFKDGSFEFHYADMISGTTSNYANGNSAVIWVENAAGNYALFYGINQPVITSDMALRFEPR